MKKGILAAALGTLIILLLPLSLHAISFEDIPLERMLDAGYYVQDPLGIWYTQCCGMGVSNEPLFWRSVTTEQTRGLHYLTLGTAQTVAIVGLVVLVTLVVGVVLLLVRARKKRLARQQPPANKAKELE